jgi:hypothetical protein
MNTQKPSSLDLRMIGGAVFFIELTLSSRVEEHVLEWSNADVYDLGETKCWFREGGDGEKVITGCWGTMPLRLMDFNIIFFGAEDGSCRGYRQGTFISWTPARASATSLIVGRSDGSLFKHFSMMSATIRAALVGKRPFIPESIISDKRLSSVRKGLLHLMILCSSFEELTSRFFLPVISSSRTTPKLHTLLLGVSKPFSKVSTERFAADWREMNFYLTIWYNYYYYYYYKAFLVPSKLRNNMVLIIK